MQINRATALTIILEDEGPELNVGGSEPGGASKFGISVSFLNDFFKKHGYPTAKISDVSALTADVAKSIYAEMLLDPLHFDELPGGVDYRLADIATNLGMTGGPIALQLALGLWPLTGVMDSLTLMTAKVTDSKVLIASLSAAWIATKHTSPNWNPSAAAKTGFGQGWSARNQRATARALAMVSA